MKSIFFKMFVAVCFTVASDAIYAQAVPGNNGVNPGNSNGGSGIQTQPNINPNNTAGPNQNNSGGVKGAAGSTGYSGQKGSTGMVGHGNSGATSPKKNTSNSTVGKPGAFSPENQPAPK